MRKFIFIIILLAGCKEVPMLPTIRPYKIDIQQGNYVTQEMVAKLKHGMTRSQVRFLLGTPLIVDPFRTNRWDYVYVFKKAGETVEQRRIALIFQDDKLTRIEGDVVPANTRAATGGMSTNQPKPAPAQLKPQTGVPNKPEATKPEIAAPAAAAPATSTLNTTAGAPMQSGPAQAEPAKAGTSPETAKPGQPQEEKGFFGRMMETLRF